MRDQDVITRLVELHDHIQAPATPAGEDALRGARLVRRRRTVSVAAAAATTVLAVGVVEASLPDGQRDLQPAPAPSLPAPSDSAEAAPNNGEIFETEFRNIVARVPDWSIADTQPMFNNAPCAGNWSSEATGFGGGNFDVSTNGEAGQVWHAVIGFPRPPRRPTRSTGSSRTWRPARPPHGRPSQSPGPARCRSPRPTD